MRASNFSTFNELCPPHPYLFHPFLLQNSHFWFKKNRTIFLEWIINVGVWAEITFLAGNNYLDPPHSQGVWNMPHKFHLYLIEIIILACCQNGEGLKFVWPHYKKIHKLDTLVLYFHNSEKIECYNTSLAGHYFRG